MIKTMGWGGEAPIFSEHTLKRKYLTLILRTEGLLLKTELNHPWSYSSKQK